MEKYLNVSGMSCSACASTIEKALNRMNGIQNVNVNLMNNKVFIKYDENIIDINVIIETINGLGYKVEKDIVKNSINKDFKKVIVSAVLSILLMDIAMGHMLHLPIASFIYKYSSAHILLQLLLATIIIIINRNFIIKGIKAIYKKAPTMDSLVAIGSMSSYIYGIIQFMQFQFYNDTTVLNNLYLDGAAMILTFISIGKYLESKSKNKSKEAIDKLLDLKPTKVLIKKDNNIKEIEYDKLCVDDIVIVNKGDKIPCDGILVSKSGFVDESLLTGESLPVNKKSHDNLIAGTINNGDQLEMIAKQVGNETSLNKMADLVMKSINTKPQIARIADKISSYFVPTIILLAVLVFSYWLIISDFKTAINFGISVLVISCPCALGLATPVSIVTSMGTSAKNGILVKNGAVLEVSGDADIIFLDKTGTISEGKPQVISTNIDNSIMKNVSLLESNSNHPLAKAIVEYIDPSSNNVTNIHEELGKGIKANIDNHMYLVGNDKFLMDHNIEIVDNNEIAQFIYVAIDNQYIGSIKISDPIKKTAKKAITELKNQGYKTVMLSGDNKRIADYIGKEVDIDYVISEVLPTDKQKYIKQAQEENYKVIMVGDGVNDALALSSANVGIAMNSGSDIAIDTADVVLRNNDLLSLVNYLKFSKKTILNIKENLFWAIIYNVIAIPIAAGVFYKSMNIYLQPMIAALAMSCSSLFVLSNSLRLRKMEKVESEDNKIMKNYVITIDGMMCEHCQKRVYDEINKFGVENLEVDLTNKTASFALAEDIDVNDIVNAINNLGYTVKDVR